MTYRDHNAAENDIGAYYRAGDRTISLSPPESEEGPPVEDPRQSIHPSVLERWDADPTYRPGALRSYLQRVGDPGVT